MKKIFCVCCVCLGIALQSNASELVLPKLSSPPVIDGEMKSGEWKDALAVKSLKPYYPNKPVSQKTEVYLGYDDERLYIGVVCRENQMGKLKRNILKRDGTLWTDDCVEIFLTTGKNTKKHSYYYHFIVTLRGTQYDSETSVAKSNVSTRNLKWDGAWIAKSSIGKDRWSCEVAIPFHILDIGDGEWTINVGREEKPSNELSSLSGPFKNFSEYHIIKGMSLDLSKHALVIDELDFDSVGFGVNSFVARGRNKKSSAVEVVAETILTDSTGKEISKSAKTANLAGGKKIEIASSFEIPKVNLEYTLLFSLLNPKSHRTLASRSMRLAIPSALEAVLSSEILYLSEKALNCDVMVNLGGETLNKCVLEANVEFADKQEASPDRVFKLEKAKTAVSLPVGSLKPGLYKLTLTLKYADGKVIEKRILGFEKLRGPFE